MNDDTYPTGQWSGKAFFLGLEGIFNYVNRENRLAEPAWLTQFRVPVGWRITSEVSLTLGLTLNHVFGKDSAFPEFNHEHRIWMGYHTGLEIWL